MGNLVYPTLPGLAFSVTRSIKTPPTTVKTTPSLREYRVRSATQSRVAYELQYEFLRSSAAYQELQALAGFYNNVGGQFDDWLFSDPDDNTSSASLFGSSDGTTKQFQLLRSYGGFAEPVYAIDGTQPPFVFANGYNTNLINNGGFETQISGRPAGFSEYNNPGTSTTYTGPADRTGAGLAYGLLANAPNTSGSFGLFGGDAVVDPPYTGGVRAGGWHPNTTYTVSFWAYKLNGASWTNMGLAWNVLPASVVEVENPGLTNSWQRYVFTVQMGATVEGGGRIYITTRGNTASGDQIIIDDLRVEYGSTVTDTIDGDFGYTIDYSTGILSFDFALNTGFSFSWTGSFYKRCRFTDDNLDTSKFMKNFFEAKKVKFMTVIP